MQQLVVFAALFSCAFANLIAHAPPAHVVPGPTILHKNVHHVEQVHPVEHVQRTVVPVHHPPVTSVQHAPTAVLAKAPRIHGYAYTSEVKHDAPVAVAHAAPVVAHAAPVVAAAPVVSKVAAPLVGHGLAGPVAAPLGLGLGLGAPLGLGHGLGAPLGLGHGLAAPIAAPILGHGAAIAAPLAYGHGYGAKAPIVSGGHIVKVGAAPVEHPQVSSYAIETGRTHVATQNHYGVAYKQGVVNVPAVKQVAVQHVPVASYVSHPVPVAHGVGLGLGHGLKY